MTTKQKFIKFLEEKAKYESGFIGIVVCFPNQEKPELIVNFGEEIITKLAYFMVTYDEDLVHKMNREIRILKYGWYADFEDLEKLIEDYKKEGEIN